MQLTLLLLLQLHIQASLTGVLSAGLDSMTSSLWILLAESPAANSSLSTITPVAVTPTTAQTELEDSEPGKTPFFAPYWAVITETLRVANLPYTYRDAQALYPTNLTVMTAAMHLLP